MIINVVVAASDNNVIGKDNKLLWHLPNDLAFFKNITWGMPVIMGRKTYESMGKPLKGRTNIVVSRKFPPREDVLTATSVELAVKESEQTDVKECYIIGGGEIYRQALPVADRIYMTRVHTKVEGDTFFPSINDDEWQLVSSTSFDADTKHAFPYTFEIWQRKPRK